MSALGYVGGSWPVSTPVTDYIKDWRKHTNKHIDDLTSFIHTTDKNMITRKDKQRADLALLVCFRVRTEIN